MEYHAVVMPSRLPGDGAALSEGRPAGLGAGVLMLCTLPWLNPFSFGPVPSVFPWLLTAVFASLGVVVCLPSTGRRAGARGAVVFAICVAWLAWPRAATLTPYELLALSGGVLLIALGTLLALAPGRMSVVSHPWPYWCAVWPWLVAGLISSVFALLQYTGNAAALTPWINWAPPGEAFANLRQRNQFASLTNIALAALLAWQVLPRRTAQASARSELLLAAALALLAVGNAASASRTGLLQLWMVAALVLCWRRERRVALWLTWALACYAIGAVALPWFVGLDPSMHGMFSRLRTGDALCSSRLTLWRNVLDLIAQRPWLGWGWGELDYAHYMTLYEGPRFCDILDNAHNLPLHLAVELGVPAALVFCGLCLWALMAQRPWRETDPLRQMAWMVLAVIALHSLLEYPLWYGPFQLACGLSLGLLWRGQPVRRRRAIALPLVWASLLLGACFYAAWDYRRISQIYLPPAQRLPQYQEDTLAKIQHSWLFRRQVQFAELSISTVTPENAAHIHALASALLHFSPEAKLVEKLLDAALVLGYDEEVRQHRARFEAAFPDAYARWVARQGLR